jgi:hypothetical protein
VIVPVHGWCQNNVAATHLDPSAVDGCEAPFTLDDEPHRESHVSMCGCSLVGHYQLKTSIQSVGCIWCICGDTVRDAAIEQESLLSTYLEPDSPASRLFALLASLKSDHQRGADADGAHCTAKHEVLLKGLEHEGSAFPSEPIAEEYEWSSDQT